MEEKKKLNRPISVIYADAKQAITRQVGNTMAAYGLPIFMAEGILSGVLAEIRANAANELADDTARYEEELKAHYEKLFYYDNKQKGEVDFLVDDSSTMSVLPIEVKSGKDYTVHSALDNLMTNQDYHIVSSIVLSNEREIKTKGNILYLPIYHVMFLENKVPEKENLYF